MSSAATLEEAVERIVQQVLEERQPLHGLVYSVPRYSTLDLVLVLLSEKAREHLLQRLNEELKPELAQPPEAP